MIGGLVLVALAAAAVTGVLLDGPDQGRPGATGISVTALGGRQLSLPDGRPVVLGFVAATCGDCLSDIETLGTVRAAAGDRAAYLAVGIDPATPAEDLAELLHAAGYPDLPAAVDADGSLVRAYRVSALGTVVVLASHGTVAYRAVKPRAEAVRQALAAAGATTP